jgi:small-conductance mechanosensitive channel
MSNFYFLKTFIAIIFLLLVDFVVEYLLVQKVKDRKKSIKFRVSLRWILFACFLFAMAKIWVEGFGYFITYVGIISAALTITQKEYLMNLMGWLIIMWRHLFVEGDYIEIGKHSGYVKHLGPLYFSIEEATDASWGNRTGRVVRIPNSLIANHPILSYPVEESFIEGRALFVFTFDSPIEKLQKLTAAIEKDVDSFLVTLHKEWSPKQQRLFARMQERKRAKTQCLLRVRQEMPLGIQLRVRFLSLRVDQRRIEDEIFAVVMKTMQSTPELQFSLVV